LSSLNFREITVSNASLNDYVNLFINSDVENLCSDKFIIDNLLGSSNPFTTNVSVMYDPFVEKYTANAMIMGPFTLVADELIPVMIVDGILDIDGIGQQTVVHGVLADFLVTPTIVLDVDDNGLTTVNIYSITMAYEGDLSHSSKTAVDLLSSLRWMDRMLLDNIDNRMIDLKNDNLSHLGGLWAKFYTANNTFAGNFDSKVSQMYNGINFGGDFKRSHSSGDIHYGVMGSYLSNKNTFAFGSGHIKNTGGGVYSMWNGLSGHYIGFQANTGKYTGNYTVVDGNGDDVYADFNTWGYNLMSEYSYRNAFANDTYLEPFIKFAFSRISGFDYEATSGLLVENSGIKSSLLTVGTNYGMKVNDTSTVYAGGSFYHDFAKPANSLVLGNGMFLYDDPVVISESANTLSTWFRLTAGTNIKLSSSFAFNLEGSKLLGNNINGWTANAGISLSY
jgi:outer membrane autotransporter protein